MTEAQLQAAVIEAAQLFGWRIYHTFDSRRSNAGFPDLVLVRPPEMLFVELKSEKGRVRPEQKAWIDDLIAVGNEVLVWRPVDWTNGMITRTLRHRLREKQPAGSGRR